MTRTLFAILVVALIVILGSLDNAVRAVSTRGAFGAAFVIAANALSVLSVLSVMFTWLNRHNMAFYIWFQRMLHTIFPSKSVTWDIMARYTSPQGPEVLDSFGSAVATQYNPSPRMVRTTESSREYSVANRFHVAISVSPGPQSSDGPLSEFVLRLNTLTVNYSEARDVLDSQVMPLLEAFDRLVRAADEETAYNITIGFEGAANPYMGLYVQGLQPQEVQNFRVTLRPYAYTLDRADRIDITPKVMSITVHSLQLFRTAVQDYSVFAPRLSQTTS